MILGYYQMLKMMLLNNWDGTQMARVKTAYRNTLLAVLCTVQMASNICAANVARDMIAMIAVALGVTTTNVYVYLLLLKTE